MTIEEKTQIIMEAFKIIEKHGKLSPNGQYFVNSLKKSYKRHLDLSERQLTALCEIAINIDKG